MARTNYAHVGFVRFTQTFGLMSILIVLVSFKSAAHDLDFVKQSARFCCVGIHIVALVKQAKINQYTVLCNFVVNVCYAVKQTMQVGSGFQLFFHFKHVVQAKHMVDHTSKPRTMEIARRLRRCASHYRTCYHRIEQCSSGYCDP